MSRLSDVPKVALYENVLLLNDNYEHPIHLDPKLNANFRGLFNKMEGSTVILICARGSIHLMNNMKDYDLGPSDIIINRSGSLGEFKGMSDDAQFMLFVVDANFYYPIMLSGDFSDIYGMVSQHPTCHLDDMSMEAVSTIYNHLKKLLTSGRNPRFLGEIVAGYVQTLTFLLLSELFDEVEAEERQRRAVTRGRDIYRRFLGEVETHFKEHRDIRYYADRLCLTPKYLSQVVFKESGSYAGDFIRKYVVLEAKALLKSKRYTVQQVSDFLHFNSQSFFSKYFKAATGVSPSHFQNEC